MYGNGIRNGWPVGSAACPVDAAIVRTAAARPARIYFLFTLIANLLAIEFLAPGILQQ